MSAGQGERVAQYQAGLTVVIHRQRVMDQCLRQCQQIKTPVFTEGLRGDGKQAEGLGDSA